MKQLFALTVAVAALSAPLAAAPAQAQTLRELMEDIGVQKREKPKIDFSERAPLVLPPDVNALPPPEDANALAGVNPNWPDDVDDRAEREAEAAEKQYKSEYKSYMRNPAGQIYKIRQREREEGLLYDPENALPEDQYLQRKHMRLTPEELQEVRKKNEEGAPEAQVYVEPERKNLTEPPPGYRAPSPAQPFGPGEKEEKRRSGWFSKLNPFD